MDAIQTAKNWTPNKEIMNDVAKTTGMTLTNNQQQREHVQKKLDMFRNKLKDFNKYLAFICVNLKNAPLQIRQLCGVLLKNDLRTVLVREGPSSIYFIQQKLLEGLSDQNRIIQGTCANCISHFITQHGINNWNNLFKDLFSMFKVNQNNPHFQKGIIGCIKTIIEDNMEALDEDNGGSGLKNIVPILIQLFKNNDKGIRKTAIHSITHLITGTLPNALVINMKDFLNGIAFLVNDQDCEVKKYVLRSFTLLLSHPVYISSSFETIVKFAVACLCSNEEKLVFEAVEFFNHLCYSREKLNYLDKVQPYIDTIIPILLKSMVYCEFDRKFIEEEMKAQAENENIPPQFVKNRGIDEEDENEIQYFDVGGEWNLRRCSCSCLDLFAVAYGSLTFPKVFSYIIPVLKNANESWWIKEASVLALGAIAKGCMPDFLKNNQTSNLVAGLLNILKTDKTPMIISIALWAISRFAEWLIMKNNEKYLDMALMEVLKQITSKNIHTQESACTCFSKLAVYMGLGLGDDKYMPSIIKAFEYGLKNYSKKNLIVLYETISTFADYVEYRIKRKDFVDLILSIIFQHWENIKKLDSVIISLLDVISSICMQFKQDSKPFVQKIWIRCLELIKSTYQAVEISKKNKSTPPDKNIIAAALSAFNSIVEALQAGCQGLINDEFLNMLVYCLNDLHTSTKLVAFGMVGDLARFCLGRLTGIMPKIMQSIINALEPKQSVGVLNNVTYAVGCIGLQGSSNNAITNNLSGACQKMIVIFKKKNLNKTLECNIAVAFARLSIGYPQIFSKQFTLFGKELCFTLPRMNDPEERDHIYRGLHILIISNLKASQNIEYISKLFIDIYAGISYFEQPLPQGDMKQIVIDLLNVYKTIFRENWDKAFPMIPISIRAKLKKYYNFQ